MREAGSDGYRPEWGDREGYDRMVALDLAGWAWEALRRRPDDAGRILPVKANRQLGRFPTIRLIETPAVDERGVWGWRFPRGAVPARLLARRPPPRGSSRPGSACGRRRPRRFST